jgi:hypothetical protein
MAETKQAPLVGKKSRDPYGTPYLVFTAPGWEWRILKTYQNDQAKQYARWFVRASGPGTMGGFDLGDEYSYNVLRYGHLTEVDGRDPTEVERQEVAGWAARSIAPDF